jgi:diguanylate cyclase (GGDEF)-like protein
MKIKRILIPSSLALSVVFFALQTTGWCAPPKRVLVLHNFNQDHPAIARYDEGLREVLQASEYDIRISNEYLNLASLEHVPGYIPETAAYLAMKYSSWRPDVITTDNATFPIYDKFLRKLYPEVPVFVPREYNPDEAASPPPNMTVVNWGVTQADLAKNMELILSLRPKTKTIHVVLGTSVQEQIISRRISIALAKYAGRVSLITTEAMTYAALLDKLSKASGDEAVLFLRFARDAAGESYIPAKVLDAILRRSAVPVFTKDRHLLGGGAVGGYVQDNMEFGRFMGRMILDALDGKMSWAGSVVTANAEEYAFDWRALVRWGIDEGRLPPGSRVDYKEPNLWEAHRDLVLGGVALVVAETFLLIGLVINRLRRKRAEAALVSLNATLERRVMHRTKALHESNEELLQAKDELETLNATLNRISRTDSLTGLANRRHAEEMLLDALHRFNRYGAVFSVVMADIDFFKNINDANGHAVGDRLLRLIADDLIESSRACDMVSRWGGEEFLLLLPGVEVAGARTLAERIRRRIETARHVCCGVPVSVTVTVGLAVVHPGDAVEDVIRRADEALYRGKAAGRNRVVAA